MSPFIPRSQQEITDALLALQNSDPVVQAGLLPTDLNEGSLERAHIEAQALLLEESDQRFAQALVYGISESCYRAFGFSLLPPKKAIGGVLFSTFVPSVAGITIPAGAQVIGPSGVIFETTAAGAIGVGEMVSAAVPIRCLVAGTAGNVPQESITKLVSPIAGIDMVVNPSRTAGGSETESSDARSVRFAAFLRTLVRGTKEALEFAALSASPQVRDARAIEPFMLDPRPDGVPFSGLVWLFVDDGTDSATLDPGVESEVTKLVEGYVDGSSVPVPGYKAAGTRVEVRKVGVIPVYCRASISLRPGGVSRWGEIQASLTAAASEYFERLRIGEKASYQNLITFLSSADSDISEVDLAFWTDAGAPPYYSAPLSAEDLAFYNPSDVSTVGARGMLFQGAGLGPSGSAVTYPEWRLG